MLRSMPHPATVIAVVVCELVFLLVTSGGLRLLLVATLFNLATMLSLGRQRLHLNFNRIFLGIASWGFVFLYLINGGGSLIFSMHHCLGADLCPEIASLVSSQIFLATAHRLIPILFALASVGLIASTMRLDELSAIVLSWRGMFIWWNLICKGISFFDNFVIATKDAVALCELAGYSLESPKKGFFLFAYWKSRQKRFVLLGNILCAIIYRTLLQADEGLGALRSRTQQRSSIPRFAKRRFCSLDVALLILTLCILSFCPPLLAGYLL